MLIYTAIELISGIQKSKNAYNFFQMYLERCLRYQTVALKNNNNLLGSPFQTTSAHDSTVHSQTDPNKYVLSDDLKLGKVSIDYRSGGNSTFVFHFLRISDSYKAML